MNLRWGHFVSETTYRGYAIIVRKGNIFYKGFIKDEGGNSISKTPFCEDEEKAMGWAKGIINEKEKKEIETLLRNGKLRS